MSGKLSSSATVKQVQDEPLWTLRSSKAFRMEAGVPRGERPSMVRLMQNINLKETPSADYSERTSLNLRDSDALVVFTLAERPTDSCRQRLAMAKKLKKPCVHFHRGILAVGEKLVNFLAKHHVKRLNIGGSSEADEPEIYDWVMATLKKTQQTIEGQSRFGPVQSREKYSRR